jgi:hypothetical protein
MQEGTRISTSSFMKITRLLSIGMGLALAASLVRFAATGLSSRYWSDDYCYSSVFAAGGLLRGPIDWFMASGNRFSTIYLVGLQDWFGPGAIRLVPALILLALALGWLVFLRAAARAGLFKADPLALTALALAQVFFLVLLAPDRTQTIYWRMGALHYTFPLALLLLNLAACTAELGAAWAARIGGAGRLLYGLGVFLLAFFAGGFSETFAALQAGVFALGCAAALLHPHTRQRVTASFLPALAGGLTAMGLMLLSPSNAWRQAALPPPASLGEFLFYTLRYTLDFAADTLRGAPLPLLALALLSGACAWIASPHNAALPTRKLIGFALLSLLAGLALSACAVAPSVYAGLQFPAGRALMPARFALLLGLSAASACLAQLFLPTRPMPALRGGTLTNPLLILALLASGAYLARHLSQPLPEQARMSAWAQRWDERDAQIWTLKAAGQTDLVLNQTEVVRGLEDIGPDPAHWVNRCTAAYYNLNSIQALP